MIKSYKIKFFFQCFLLITLNQISIGQAKQPGQRFEVVSRKSLTSPQSGILNVGANNTVITYKFENERKPRYNIGSSQLSFSIDALSNIEYSRKSNRIVTYGDSLEKHVASNAYVRIYSGTGSLVKSLGLVANRPFVATLSESGNFIIAGNKSEAGNDPKMFLATYNNNGTKQWENAIPNNIPTAVFGSPGNKYTALMLYNSETLDSRIYYYNVSGRLLFVDSIHSAISGMEFTNDDKVVLCTGTIWFLYDLKKEYKLLHSGVLPGNTIGKFPVSVHPTKNIFFIITTEASTSIKGYNILAFNSISGALLAQRRFEGELFWQPHRLVNISDDESIELLGTSELIKLRLTSK